MKDEKICNRARLYDIIKTHGSESKEHASSVFAAFEFGCDITLHLHKSEVG